MGLHQRRAGPLVTSSREFLCYQMYSNMDLFAHVVMAILELVSPNSLYFLSELIMYS